ncbi:hypothetical protein [Petroclostridium sp. X23]|uniref:hypothetical protein n=1 Tax=Petroclostridium sp. X23 TaxID=3045146 RepID=UPI0024ACBF2E|nr:hypothetical protein [Petroclostridium sp. X23]WHH59168.1 hypothetical protein QKW49_25840 [Petroclostridium sp. X23]
MNKSLSYIKKSGVKIKLADGKIHELKYDMNSLEYLNEEFGSIKNLDSIELDNPKNIKILMRAGLLHEYEEGQEPTLREIGKLLDVEMIMNFEKYIGDALLLSMPETDDENIAAVKKK